MIPVLISSSLFKGIEEDKLEQLLATVSYQLKSYKKGELIAVEGDNCEHLGIIISGNIQIQKSHSSGKIVVLDLLAKGDLFGEVIIFSQEHRFPATILSVTASCIFLISKAEIKQLCIKNELFLENFLQALTNKILMLNRKVKTLSYKTIREKIANLLMEEYLQQKTPLLTLPYKRHEMADLLGIPRPSLSRELSVMKEEGLIDYYRNTVKLLKPDQLKDLIF